MWMGTHGAAPPKPPTPGPLARPTGTVNATWRGVVEAASTADFQHLTGATRLYIDNLSQPRLTAEIDLDKTTAARQSSDGLTSPSPTTASARAAPEITTSTGVSTAKTTPKPGASSIPTPMWAHSAPSGNYSSSRNPHNSRRCRKGAASISRLLLRDGGFRGVLKEPRKYRGATNKSRLPLKSLHQQEEREMLAEEVTPL